MGRHDEESIASRRDLRKERHREDRRGDRMRDNERTWEPERRRSRSPRRHRSPPETTRRASPPPARRRRSRSPVEAPRPSASSNRRRSPPADREDRRRRSRSPRRRRSRSRDGDDKQSAGGAVPKFLLERPKITEKDLEGKSEEEQEMLKMMGFAGFDTTKGKKVPGNDVSAVHVIPKRKYRQYMNRKGGFNRPLDFVS